MKSLAWLLLAVSAVSVLLEPIKNLIAAVREAMLPGVGDGLKASANAALSSVAQKAEAAKKAAAAKKKSGSSSPSAGGKSGGGSSFSWLSLLPALLSLLGGVVWFFFFRVGKKEQGTDYYQGLLGLSDEEMKGKSKAYLAGVAKKQKEEKAAALDGTGAQMAGLKVKGIVAEFGQAKQPFEKSHDSGSYYKGSSYGRQNGGYNYNRGYR